MFSKWVNAFVNVRSFARLLTYSLGNFDVTAAVRSTRKVNVSCYYRACYTDRITCLFVRVCYKQAIYKVLSTLYTIKLPYATPRRRSVACVCVFLFKSYVLSDGIIQIYRYYEKHFPTKYIEIWTARVREFDNLEKNFRELENFNKQIWHYDKLFIFLQLGNLRTWDPRNLETRKGWNVA